MSKHMKVDGKLLQMNKSYSQLKQKQKAKISEWMYEAYKLQQSDGISDADAVEYVYNKIEDAEIWIPFHEIEKRYHSRKSAFRKRDISENVPEHIRQMEAIYERLQQRANNIEKSIDEYIQLQSEMKKLEEYYTSQQWKEDFAMDERGEFPRNIQRGILSEDGIYNLLEQNKEIMDRIKTEDN